MQRTVSTITGALLLAGVANASPLVPTLRSRAVATVTGWESTGCYTDSTSSRALTGYSYYDDFMTAEKCATVCGPFAYFGLEYGRECFCGNTINTGSVSASAGDCNFPCPGNNAQDCGAGDRLNLYTRTSAPPTPSAPATTYTDNGCYTEATTGRALSSAVFYDDLMTTEKCATVCSGYTYFGLEYGRECFCGNILNAGSVPTSIAECNFQCPGKNSEFCGAGNRLNLYKNGATTDPSSSSSVISSSTTTSAESSSTTDPSSTTSIGSSSTSSSESSSSTVAKTTSESSSTTTTISTTSDVESSTTSTESSTTTTTMTTTTTTTTTTTPSPTPDPNVVINSGFEGDTSPWVPKTTNPSWFKYNLADNSINAHTGLKTGSITYLKGSPPLQTWFNQPITVAPSTTYKLTAFAKASTANPGCNVYFYIGDASGGSVILIFPAIPTSQLGPNWAQTTGSWTSPATITAYTMNVRLTCTSTFNANKSFYVDDITFAPA